MRCGALIGCLGALLALASDARGQGESLTLGEAIRMAHSSSPMLRASAAEVERADAEHAMAVAGYLPRVTAGLTGAGQILRDTLPPIRPPYTHEPYRLRAGSAEGRADVRWTFWDFGRTSGAAAIAALTRDAREHSAHATQAEVTRTVATLFLTVLYDAQILESTRTSLRHRTRHAALAKGLVEKGVRPPIDEVRARLNVEAARQDLAAAEGRLLIDRERLASALGVESAALGQPTKPSLPVVDEPLASASRAAEARPEVAAASSSSAAREEAVAVARAQYLPTVGLAVSGAYRLTRYVDGGSELVPRSEVSGQLTVTVPIFDLHTVGSVAEARAALAVGKALEAETRRRAKEDATVAALELRTARAVDARARDLAASTHAALGVVEARYLSGLASPLELVDAEASDLEAREALLGAEHRQQIAAVDLVVATGRATLLRGK